MASTCTTCSSCAEAAPATLRRLGIRTGRWDHLVALAGNPNTGKSTVFNALTGLRQHTGNWPGKTLSRAEGSFAYGDKRYKLVDLPGVYSLLSMSPDEEVARDFLLLGRPDAVIVVCDATALTRNLLLALQVMRLTTRVVLALNLMDEARARGLRADAAALEHELGVPVVPISARSGEGLPELLEAVQAVVSGERTCSIPLIELPAEVAGPINEVKGCLLKHWPQLEQPDWIALRLLEGDVGVSRTLREGLARGAEAALPGAVTEVEQLAASVRQNLPDSIHDVLAERYAEEAAHFADLAVKRVSEDRRLRWQKRLDLALTSKWTGLPLMGLLFAIVLWLTIAGANVPSSMLATLLVDNGHALLKGWAGAIGLPVWLNGLLIDGMYLTTAWVISVMLPPMAIFFPLFTLLEDFGYLPRVAFNLDGLLSRCGAHGKQSLSMAMGYGCNAAGVIATRIIDSPRERLVAILTNNFSLCNGRWPTQILIATIFLGALVGSQWSSLVAALAVTGVMLLGVALTLGTSWLLSRTVLKGEASAFTLELPPYRVPRLWSTLYRSVIDRTLFVLWRAVVFALPAGLAIWLSGQIDVGGVPLAVWLIERLDVLAWPLGLTGVILFAYIVAIPANEIVIPTILMATVMVTGMEISGAAGAGVLFETDEGNVVRQLLEAGGWTTLTAICLMLFSLCHNPCSTTLYTIYKETGSARWTAWAALMPTAIGAALCAIVAAGWRLFA